MIEIQNIKSTNIDDVVNILLDEKKQPFQIYFPKSTQLYFSTNDAIAEDYARLAYVGYKLKTSSEQLNYEFVMPDTHDSVLFEVYSLDVISLAVVLLELSYLYGNVNENYDYLRDVYEYVDTIELDKGYLVCSDFLEVYKEYIKK